MASRHEQDYAINDSMHNWDDERLQASEDELIPATLLYKMWQECIGRGELNYGMGAAIYDAVKDQTRGGPDGTRHW